MTDEAKAIEPRRPEAPMVPTGRGMLTPKTFDEAMEFARMLSDSELVPKEYRGKPANILVAMQMGSELGLSPMASLQSICVINGKPSLYGDAVPGLILASGLCEYIREYDLPQIRKERKARCEMLRRGWPEPTVRTFGEEDAKKAGLLNKDTYKAYGERMFRWRALAWCARDVFPDVLKGLSIREEVMDYAPAREPGAMLPQRASELEAAKSVEEAQVVAAAEGSADREEAEAPANEGELQFEINGVNYTTQGITKPTLLKTFQLGREVGKLYGPKKASEMMRDRFPDAESRTDLSEEQGQELVSYLESLVVAKEGGAE